MARQTRYDLTNMALGGQLPILLAEAREAGVAFDDIAYDLRDRGIDVSGETVRQWCLEHLPATTEAAS